MKKSKRSAKASTSGKGNAYSRREVRELTRRVNVPRSSKRPLERRPQKRTRRKGK